MKKISLHNQIFIAILVSLPAGFFLHNLSPYISWIGTIFIKLLKVLALPLVIVSVISGMIKIGGGKDFFRLTTKTFIYYIATSLIAITTGLIFSIIILPGKNFVLDFFDRSNQSKSIANQNLGDILLNIIPTNIFESLSKGDVLGAIIISIIFGYSCLAINNEKKFFLQNFFDSLFEVLMKMTELILKTAPIGIFCLLFKTFAEFQGDTVKFINLFKSVGLYFTTVILSLAFHFFITLNLLLFIIGKTNPFFYIKKLSPALASAFATSSSNATLPITIKQTEAAGISKKISGFVLPLGATINMDGTALYECVAVLFIAEVYGFELALSQQIFLVLLSLLVSIGAAGIPMAGLVMMNIILSALGLPLEGIAIILTVDRFLDMARTTVNVYSDACGCAIIAKSENEFNPV